MAWWMVKVKRFDDGIHVDTWMTRLEAETEDGAEGAELDADALHPTLTLPFSGGTSFATWAERVGGG